MGRIVASSAELAERHRPAVLAYLVRVLGDREEAEDACQEAFLRAHRAVGRLGADANARAWLYRIATNCAMSAARRRARKHARATDVDPDGLPAVMPSPETRAQLRRVAVAVRALPPRQRAALMLRQFQGFAYAEIADSLGGSETGARANVYQALKKLRAALGES